MSLSRSFSLESQAENFRGSKKQNEVNEGIFIIADRISKRIESEHKKDLPKIKQIHKFIKSDSVEWVERQRKIEEEK